MTIVVCTLFLFKTGAIGTASAISQAKEQWTYYHKLLEVYSLYYLQPAIINIQAINAQHPNTSIGNDEWMVKEVKKGRDLLDYLQLNGVKYKGDTNKQNCDLVWPAEITKVYSSLSRRNGIFGQVSAIPPILFSLRSVNPTNLPMADLDYRSELLLDDILLFYGQEAIRKFICGLSGRAYEAGNYVIVMIISVEILLTALATIIVGIYIIIYYKREKKKLSTTRGLVLLLPDELLNRNAFIHKLFGRQNK